MRQLLVCLALAGSAFLTGCATTSGSGASQQPAEPKTAAQKIDPWENWNRKVYSFNDTLDEAVFKPVATAYTKAVPQPIRQGVTNFFGNVSDIWSAVNNLLQGKVAAGFEDVFRVSTNTLFGLGGFFDIASDLGLEKRGEDFGQTLGVWGMEAGPYIVWPLLGPSSLRESLALPFDIQATPTLVITDTVGVWAVGTLQVVNQRANLLGATRMLDEIALDKYAFVRDAYLQRRRSLVFDGNPPEPPVDDDDGDPPPPAAPAASAAPSSGT